MATRPFSGCRCACSSSLTTVVVLQLHCKLGTPRFPALRPRLMQLPFLLAFLSLLSLAHFHLLSAAAAEEVSISSQLFIYETVADSLIQAASDAQESSFLHTNLLKEEHDHILIADDGVHEMAPTPAEPFRYDSVAASLSAGASCTQGCHVQSGNVSSFTHEADVRASHQTTARGDNIWQITRAPMHLEADHHQSSHLSDHTLQEKNSFLLRDSGNHMQSDAKRENPVITKPPTVYESAGAPIRSGAHRSSLLLVDNMENAFLLDDGGKQVGKSPSEVASFTKEGGDLLQDSVPQEKYELLRDDGHTLLVSGTQHIDHDSKSKILIVDSANPQEDHLVDNGGKHVEHTGSLKSSQVEEETFLHDNVPQGEYSLLLGDGVWKELHIKELPSLKDEERKNHIKLPLLRGNLRMVVDDSTESTMKNIAHDHIPEAKVSTSNDDNLKMVVGDSSNWMIEKGNRPQACITKDSPNVEKLRMVVGDSSHNMIQKGHQGRRGRSRSCSASNSNVCRQLADEEYLNHIVLYGRPRRMRSRQPACCSGTCVDLSDNDIHCGICGLPCHLLETCCNGKCVKLDTDDSNCGECGNACPTSSSCQFGLCGYY